MKKTAVASDQLWPRLRQEAKRQQKREPLLAEFLQTTILDQKNFSAALGHLLSGKLADAQLDTTQWQTIIADAHRADRKPAAYALKDLAAILDRDPAAQSVLQAFLYLKGFHALQAHRVGHFLWMQDRQALAYYLQNRISEILAIDIHPAARIGYGVMMDHATGIVIGETSVVGNNVSMLHGVTLGGTGKECGDRHPKIGNGVLLGTSCHVLGNIRIGKGAKVAAGSVVLEDVPAGMTVAGVPARPICRATGVPGKNMNQRIKE